MIKEDESRAATIVRTAVNLVHLFAVVSWPVMPATSERLLRALHRPTLRGGSTPGGGVGDWLGMLAPGHAFEVPEILFRQGSDANVAEWAQPFGGAEGS